jgi:transposase-like protein
MEVRYGGFELDCPKCGKHGKFSKISKQPAYQCAWCGNHIHPMVGTPFEKSRTPLQKWFYAMYLFTTSRHGVPAKELQRQLAVTYKTAWRMGHEIRKYMGNVDGDPTLYGDVEADETYIGGRPRYRNTTKPGLGAKKTAVFGAIERGGRVRTNVIEKSTGSALEREVDQAIVAGSRVFTDEWSGYNKLSQMGYKHFKVNHRAKEVSGNGAA